jgi:ferrous iron transport protein A
MSLEEILPGASCRIESVNGGGAIRQRLMDMGLLPDVELRVERKAPGGDPIWVNLGGWQIALRENEARNITVIACA